MDIYSGDHPWLVSWREHRVSRVVEREPEIVVSEKTFARP